MQKELEELKSSYRIAKMLEDNTSLILRQIEELTERIERLEAKIA